VSRLSVVPWADSPRGTSQDERLLDDQEPLWGPDLTPDPLVTTFSFFHRFAEEIRKGPVSTSSFPPPRDLAKTIKKARLFLVEKRLKSLNVSRYRRHF